MDVIIFQNELYYLYPVTKTMFINLTTFDIIDCFSLCDLLRQNLKINGIFFGCICH